MAVDDIRLLALQVLYEPVREWQIHITRTKQILYVDTGAARGRVNPGTRRTNENRLMTALGKRRNQVDHLLWPAIKMAPCFDIQYFHEPNHTKIARRGGRQQ